jgi:hypothetical protein
MPKVKLIFIAALITILLPITGCPARHDLDDSIKAIIAPYRFSLAGWEFRTILGDLRPRPSPTTPDASATAREYFALAPTEARKAELTGQVEGIISRQIKEVLTEQGINNPFDKYIGLKIHFPPVYFKLQEPPKALVISPRGRIEEIASFLLRQDITTKEEEEIEARVDKLGVSSLVVTLGGVGAYPSLVADTTDLKSALDTIAHEWVHHYLTFRPLGFLYLLDTAGISPNYEVATIDETVADIAGQEISALVYQKYYPTPPGGEEPPASHKDDFFNSRMREIRRNVDAYLLEGQINEAEKYMEAQRQSLAAEGYYIRKLNQAYFAFYGTYADSPTSISPIGAELKELRAESASLKEFLTTVATITSEGALKAALNHNL